jgi:hypothetical protein
MLANYAGKALLSGMVQAMPGICQCRVLGLLVVLSTFSTQHPPAILSAEGVCRLSCGWRWTREVEKSGLWWSGRGVTVVA